jgi:hypothetical protein
MKFLGATEDITTCDLCGKQNLKRTIVIEMADGGIVHYGCDCAAKSLKAAGVAVKTADVDTVASMMMMVERLLKTSDLKVVAAAVWNKFGYLNEVKGSTLRVKTAAGIIEIGK